MVRAVFIVVLLLIQGCSAQHSDEPLTPAEYREQYEESRRDAWLLTVISSLPAILLAAD